MPNNFQGNIFNFFLKQKIEWNCFNSLDSAFHNLVSMLMFLNNAIAYTVSPFKLYFFTSRTVCIGFMTFLFIFFLGGGGSRSSVLTVFGLVFATFQV